MVSKKLIQKNPLEGKKDMSVGRVSMRKYMWLSR